MDEIETCSFIICFDDPLPAQYFNSPINKKGKASSGHWVKDRDETNMLHQMLHGGGSVFNTGNRWFDKTLQVTKVSRASFDHQCCTDTPTDLKHKWNYGTLDVT